MANIKLHQRLALLRKQKGLTQEELAQVFGVTNQSVSKWESGACCPDIALLPDIADFFGVSIDDLFEHTTMNSFDETVKGIKQLIIKTPEADCFDLAYKLAFFLHEGACSKGYRGYIPWDMNKERKTDDDYYKWGSSAVSEPYGVSVMRGGTVLVSSQRHRRESTPEEMMAIWSEMQKYADVDRLAVFLALYELTCKDFGLFVSIQTVMDKAHLSEDKTREALKWLPIQQKRLDDGSFGYRIEGCNMHIPSILLLFLQH